MPRPPHPHKAEILAAYLALPRVGKGRKRPGARLQVGYLQPFLKEFGIHISTILRWARAHQPWNK